MANTTHRPRADTGVRHIIWDWNGTLLDDNHANLAAVNAVCDAYGAPQLTLQDWRRAYYRPLLACYQDLLGHPLDDADWSRLNSIYGRAYLGLLAECPLADGVEETLSRWRAAGRTQSLLSMATHDHVARLVADRGVDHHFTRVDGRARDATEDSKTEHLVGHLAALGADPAEVVLVGDIDDDAHAAHAAGARAVLVTTGLMDTERLRATGAPVVDSVADAVALTADLPAGSRR